MNATYVTTATCPAILVQKILEFYKAYSDELTQELFTKARKHDISNPAGKVPLQFVNELTDWIEKKLGPANLKIIGSILGEMAYKTLKANKKLPDKAGPKEIMEKLHLVSQSLVEDPTRKYWQVLEVKNNYAKIRKSHTMNSTLQTGIIETFIRKAGLPAPRTRVVKDYKRGPEYDEYEITWF